jgi:chemotaxis-related protein WspD
VTAGAAMRPPAVTLGHIPSPLLAGVIADSAIEAGLLDGALLERELTGLLR